MLEVHIAKYPANWFLTCRDQVAILSGKAASPQLINRIINICCEHDPRILSIDTV